MSNKNKYTASPPKLATRFLNWYCRRDLLDEVEGDLYELFQRRVETHSLWKAKALYWLNVLMFLHPDYIQKRKKYYPVNHTTMFRHNFIISFRSFQRHKSTFFINLIGLSSGLACTLLIYLWVNDELSIDKFHEKDDQLFQVMEHKQQTNDIWTSSSTSGLVAESLAEEMPEVEYAVTTRGYVDNFTLSIDENNIRASGQYVGKEFFNVFPYPLIQGDKNQVLADKNSIVISEELAMRLFNTTENIIGKIVAFQHEKHFLISGIFETVPAHSSE